MPNVHFSSYFCPHSLLYFAIFVCFEQKKVFQKWKFNNFGALKIGPQKKRNQFQVFAESIVIETVIGHAQIEDATSKKRKKKSSTTLFCADQKHV